MPELFAHQVATRDHILNNPRCLVLNDPGTGKTVASLVAIQELQSQGAGRALVFAPKSILEPSWVDDCKKFTPDLSIAAAFAHNRREAFETGANVIVTNHDAAKWVAQNPDVLVGFEILAVDESVAFKNRTSQRSKALAKIATQFKYRFLLTGTFMPNGLEDVWHQVFIIDDGERLGGNFYKFLNATHHKVASPFGFNKYVEKDGAADVVADVLADITIRYKMQDCLDIPDNFVTTREFALNKKLRAQYEELATEALIELEKGEVKAINAAVLAGKLLQVASGSVYGDDRRTFALDTQRADLVAQLVAERDHTLVAYIWEHQRDALIEAFKRAGLDKYRVFDANHAKEIVDQFQAGELQALLAHPRSASHGLTLTRAATTIWTSPTPEAELFTQFNRRIDRAGQTRETETILIQAKDTIDQRRYDQLLGKVGAQDDFLGLLKSLRPPEVA